MKEELDELIELLDSAMGPNGLLWSEIFDNARAVGLIEMLEGFLRGLRAGLPACSTEARKMADHGEIPETPNRERIIELVEELSDLVGGYR